MPVLPSRSLPHDVLAHAQRHQYLCSEEMSCVAIDLNAVLGLSGTGSGSARDELAALLNAGEYPYPTTTTLSRSTATRSSSRGRTTRHATQSEYAAVESSAIVLETDELTTSAAPVAASSQIRSTQSATLSPLRPFYNAGATPMRALSAPPSSSPVPWILGLGIPAVIVLLLWLAFLHYRKKRLAESQDMFMIDSSMATDGTVTFTREKPGLGIEVDPKYENRQTALPTLSPAALKPLDLTTSDPALPNGADGPTSKQAGDLVDRFELKQAVFPPRNQLCGYVFPSAASSVEREIRSMAEDDEPIRPIPQSATFPSLVKPSRNVVQGRTVIPSSKRIPPKQFGSNFQIAPKRRRLSPAGEVLYSTTTGGNGLLETVQEETADSIKSPKTATFGSGDGHSANAIVEDVPTATTSAYVCTSPTGLRSRRRSSPMIPEITIHEAVEDSAPTELKYMSPDAPSIAPLQINKSKRQSPNHRRSATKSEVFASLGSLEAASAEGSEPMSEEERKFAEFVKELVKKAQARDKRSGQAYIPESEEGLAQTQSRDTIDLGDGFLAVKPWNVMRVGRTIMLPHPSSVGAALSDFGDSSSTLASELPSTTSKRSMDVTL